MPVAFPLLFWATTTMLCFICLQLSGPRPSTVTPDQLTDTDRKMVGRKVLQCDGMFVTLRMATRKIGRFPSSLIKSVMESYLTCDVNSPRFVGAVHSVMQISQKSTVFYKCPPDLLQEGSTEHYDVSRHEYVLAYNKSAVSTRTGLPEMQERTVHLILENSPFAPGSAFVTKLRRNCEEQDIGQLEVIKEEQNTSVIKANESQEWVPDASSLPTNTKCSSEPDTERASQSVAPLPDFNKLIMAEQTGRRRKNNADIPTFIQNDWTASTTSADYVEALTGRAERDEIDGTQLTYSD